MSHFQNLAISSQSLVAGYTSDGLVSAFFDEIQRQGGELSESDKRAWTAFIDSAQQHGYDDKIIAFYPYLGGAPASIAVNGVDPHNTDESHRIVWSSEPHIDNGVDFDGTQTGNTKIIPREVGMDGALGGGMGFYGLEDVPEPEYTMGAYRNMYLAPNTAVKNGSGFFSVNENSSGFHFANRPPGSSLVRYWHDDNLITHDIPLTCYSEGEANVELFVGGLNDGTPLYSKVKLGCSWATFGLTEKQENDFRQDVRMLMKGLGRFIDGKMPLNVTPKVSAISTNGKPLSERVLVNEKLPIAAKPVHYTWKKISDEVAQPCDGALAFTDGTADYISHGWLAGPQVFKTFWKSEDGGQTYQRQDDVPYSGRHTTSSTSVDHVMYFVGGDMFSILNDGKWQADSWKFQDGYWQAISPDAGIEHRCLAGLAELNGKFYLVGGQAARGRVDTVYSTVLVSEDGCKSFHPLAETPFQGGNFWGAICAFKGRLWKVCGGVYDDKTAQGYSFPREMYSSADGVVWHYEGKFPGKGRQYAQTVVWDNKMWLIGGFNADRGNNLNDVWFTEDGINWTELKDTPWEGRHAASAYTRPDGIYMFGGTRNIAPTLNAQLWKLEKS